MPGRHWQLVAFTILSQLAVGLTVVLAVALGLASGRFDPGELDVIAAAWLAIVMIVLAAAVIMASAHLGSPGAALGVLANLRESWLSREAAAGAVFGLLTGAASLAYGLDLGTPAGRRWWVVAAAAAGVALVIAMARLYMLRTVPAWNTVSTPMTFLTASAILGVAASGAALAVLGARQPVARELLSGVLPWLGWVCLVLAGIQIAAGRPRLRIPSIRGWLWPARAVLGLGGAALLVASARFSASSGASLVVLAAAAILITSEIIGRFIFYASYDRVGI
jgi:anaerobic dimethyl sulfoxide reductase subunit C (anchor subunit)